MQMCHRSARGDVRPPATVLTALPACGCFHGRDLWVIPAKTRLDQNAPQKQGVHSVPPALSFPVTRGWALRTHARLHRREDRKQHGRSHNHHGWGRGQRCPWWHLASAVDSSGHRKGWRDTTGPLRCTEWIHTPKHKPALADGGVGGKRRTVVWSTGSSSPSQSCAFLISKCPFGGRGAPN